jgi:hexokinase
MYFHEVLLDNKTRFATVNIYESHESGVHIGRIVCNLLDPEHKRLYSFGDYVPESVQQRILKRFTFVAILDDVIQHSGGDALPISENGRDITSHHIFSSDFDLDA